MTGKTVLFPTDFSDESKPALRQAAALVRDSDGVLVIVHVAEPPEAFTDVGFAGYNPPTEEAELRAMLEKMVPPFEGVNYRHRLLTGHPADEIVRLAADENFDLIVMGTHGRRGLTRMLMGSVAEAVVRKSPCPVLTVRNKQEEKVPA